MNTFVDAQGHPPAAAVAAAGHVGVACYLYNTPRRIIDDYHASGLWVLLVAEFDTDDGHGHQHHPILDGAPGGHANGAVVAHQIANLAAPPGVGVAYTADGLVRPAQYPTVDAYLIAAHEHTPDAPPILYGGAGLIASTLAHGTAAAGWVAGADSWNGGVDPAACGAFGHQRGATDAARGLPTQATVGGVLCDLNDLYTDGPPLHVWLPDGTANQPGDTPLKLDTEDQAFIAGTRTKPAVLHTPTNRTFLWDGMTLPVHASTSQIGTAANIHNAGQPLAVIEVNDAFVDEMLLGLAGAPTDPAAVAATILAALGPAVAKSVADELAKRLAS